MSQNRRSKRTYWKNTSLSNSCIDVNHGLHKTTQSQVIPEAKVNRSFSERNTIGLWFFWNMFTTPSPSPESFTLFFCPVESRKSTELILMWQGYDAKIVPKSNAERCWNGRHSHISFSLVGLAILFPTDEIPLWSRVHHQSSCPIPALRLSPEAVWKNRETRLIHELPKSSK